MHQNPSVGIDVERIVKLASEMALGAARLAAKTWFESLHRLPVLFPSLPDLAAIIHTVSNPSCTLGTPYSLGARVEFCRSDTYYPATVKAIHADQTVSVEFDTPGFWGTGARHVNPALLRALDDVSDDQKTVTTERVAGVWLAPS